MVCGVCMNGVRSTHKEWFKVDSRTIDLTPVKSVLNFIIHACLGSVPCMPYARVIFVITSLVHNYLHVYF